MAGCLCIPHATIARAMLRPTRGRGRRARRSASRLVRRAFLAVRAAPLAVQIVVGTVLLVSVWAPVNWLVQVVRKPAEVFAVSGSLAKVPAQTWRQYGPLFHEHSHAGRHPRVPGRTGPSREHRRPGSTDLLAVALTWNPLELYRPASSAVGMFQITDGTFAEARRYCIHDHAVVEDGPWHDLHSCWFNGLYTRVVPGARRGDDRRAARSRRRAPPCPPSPGRPRRCSSGRTWRPSSTCAAAAPATATLGGASDSPAASDAATTTRAATWRSVNALKRQFAGLARPTDRRRHGVGRSILSIARLLSV